MEPILVISDSNILIDLEEGNLSQEVFRLSCTIAVPDILFIEELKERHSHLLLLGLKTIPLTANSVQKAESLALLHHRPSRMDLLALALAEQENCILLTGDKSLREVAMNENVEVHGTIWIVEKMLIDKIIDHTLAKNSFNQMKNNGSRLPWDEVDALLIKYQIVEEPEITPRDFQIDVTLPLKI